MEIAIGLAHLVLLAKFGLIGEALLRWVESGQASTEISSVTRLELTGYNACDIAGRSPVRKGRFKALAILPVSPLVIGKSAQIVDKLQSG